MLAARVSTVAPSIPTRGKTAVASSKKSVARAASSRVVAARAMAGGPGPFPELAVFDLDACFWDEEMYTLRDIVDPAKSVRGSLGEGVGVGVVSAMSGNVAISINPGALMALQEYHAGKYPGMRIAAASSADTPLAVRIGRSALDVLEIVPGVTARQVFALGWPTGFDGNMQIGRTPPLSSNKSQTHFPILKKETGVGFDRMLFFDDCNWGDHCAAVANGCQDEVTKLGPVVVRTPRGLQVAEWEKGLQLYNERSRKLQTAS